MHSARQVSYVARKKIVFIIVEGPSDEQALSVIFNRLYNLNQVHIEIMHGDITTDLSLDSGRIVGAIGNIIRNYAASMHFKQNDFQEVIHIVDMDGAFVPDSAIISDPQADKPFYSSTEIRTARPEKLQLRNAHKQAVLNKICSLDNAWVSIPYKVYYMSCNLDHALYGKLNSTDEEKERDSFIFAKRYKDDLGGFLSFISASEFSRVEGYKESWEFIKKDLHSLERNTNIGVCFKELLRK